MSMASTPDGRYSMGEIDVSVAPVDPSTAHRHRVMRLLNAACAVTAVGLLTVSCSTPTGSSPAAESSPSSSRAHAATAPGPAAPGSPTQTAAAGTPSVMLTSALAAFTLPAAVSRPTVFATGGGLLVVGGLTAADSTTSSILRVDLARTTVRQAGQLPVPVHDAAGAVVKGRDLLFGGGSTAVSSAVQDVTPGESPRVISHLPQPRADLVAVSDGAAGYVLGGFNGSTGSTTVLRTRDGRTFVTVGTLPVSVRYPAVAVSGGAIWLFGGEHAGRQITDVQRIDLTTGRGSVAGHLPHPLAHASAFTLRGAVFVAGGRTGAAVTDAVLRFDPARIRFTAVGHLPGALSDFGVAVVGSTAYLVGGESPKPVNTVIQVRAQAGGTP